MPRVSGRGPRKHADGVHGGRSVKALGFGRGCGPLVDHLASDGMGGLDVQDLPPLIHQTTPVRAQVAGTAAGGIPDSGRGLGPSTARR